MRRLVNVGLATLAALLALAGCSLDIDRLYGTPDGSTTPRDAGENDAAALDGGDAGDVDGGNVDGGDVDGGTRPLALAIAARITLTGSADAIAAGPSTGGAIVAVTARSVGAVSTWSLRRGADCTVEAVVPSAFIVPQAGPVAVEDLDDDGRADVIVGSDSALIIARGNADDRYALSLSVTHPLGELSALATGYFGGSTFRDVVLTSRGPSIGWVRQTSLSTFSFAPGPSGSGLVYRDGVVGDFDGDESPDLGMISAGSTTTSAVVIRGNRTGGLFGPISGALPVSASRLAITPSILGSNSLVAIGESEIWIGRIEGGALVGDVDAVSGVQLRDVVIAELDGAAPVEIVVTDAARSSLRVFHGAAGTLTRVTDLDLGAVPSELAALDVDGDGIDELAVLVGSEIFVLGRSCD